MINIEDSISISELLNKLQPDKPPVFGKLSAQHMVEHLAFTLKMSTGFHPQQLVTPEEKLEGVRRFLFSDKDMPIGAKVPFMGEEPPDLINKNLSSAKEAFLNELKKFFDCYATDASKKVLHPIFGLLDKEGWITLHNKHFKHHFRQFELI
jgi:hypothetical protein